MMSLSLQLLPMRKTRSRSFSHEILDAPLGDGLFERIIALNMLPMPSYFTCYLAKIGDEDDEHTGYGEVREDSWGDRLKFTVASELKTVGIPGPVGAFINALDDGVEVVLFWS